MEIFAYLMTSWCKLICLFSIYLLNSNSACARGLYISRSGCLLVCVQRGFRKSLYYNGGNNYNAQR